MTITFDNLRSQQAEHRREFGWMLRRWRAANDWEVWDPARLAETSGFRPLVPYGLWRLLEQGAAGELQRVTFQALDVLNQQPAIVPLGDTDGFTPRWTEIEFWACYCGLRMVPTRWRRPH